MIDRRRALMLGAGTAAMAAFSAQKTMAASLLQAGKKAPLRHVYDLQPQKITEGVWVIPGAVDKITVQNGGAIANVLVFDTKDGTVLVDTGPSYRYGVELDAVAKQLTGKPVVRIYVTHIHADHSLGATAFPSETLYGAPGLAADMQLRGNDITSAMYRATGDWMRGTNVPELKKVASDGLEQIGQRRFRCMDLKGHTASDLALFEESSGLLVTGDLVFLDRAPTTPDANIAEWRTSLAKLADIPHAKLVPGHGPVEPGKRGIEQTGAWLDFVENTITDHFQHGLDMEEMMASAMPDWTNKIAVGRYEYQRSVMHLLPHIEATRLPVLA